MALPGGEVELARPRDPEALLTEEAFEHEEFLPYWAELWTSGVALAHDVARRSLRGARVARAGLRPGAAEHRRGAGRRARAGHRLVARRRGGDGRQRGAATRPSSRRSGATGPRPTRSSSARPLQLVLASDVLYEQRNVDAAARPAAAPGGRARARPARRPRPQPGRGFLERARGAALRRATTHHEPRASRGWRSHRLRGRSASAAYSSRAAGLAEPQALQAVALVGRVEGVVAVARSRSPSLSMPRSASTASNGSVPPMRTSAGAVPQARSIAPRGEPQRRVGRVEQRRLGAARARSRHLGARPAPPRAAAARARRRPAAALWPGASRTVTWPRATPGTIVRGSPTSIMFTSTAVARAGALVELSRRRRRPPDARPRRRSPSSPGGQPLPGLALLGRGGATPALSSARTRPSASGATSASIAMSTCAAFSTAPP